MSSIQTVGASREEVIAASQRDLNFWAAFCLPEVYGFPFPPIFLAIWQRFLECALRPAGQDRDAIGLPRGFGKTIFLKLYVAWLIAFTDRKFILIVCNTATLAENFIADVMDILTSPNFIRVFGDYRLNSEKETQSLKKFTFRGRPVILAALGSGSSLRGLNIKFVRPDVIIMDDMQSREEAESPVESVKSLVWMLGTLLKANNKQRCQSIFVGNMYPFDGSILKKLKHNPSWFSFVTGAILEDGESIWPALRTVEDILDELENDTSMGHPEIFWSEVMNDEEAGSRAGIDISQIKYWQDPALPIDAEAGFVMIDPSAGKKKSDDVAIGAFMIFDAKPVMWDLSVGKYDPGKTIAEAFRLAMTYNLGAIVVEGVAYQSTLCYWFNYFIMQYGLRGLRVLEFYPGQGTKNARIIAALKMLISERRDLQLHPRVKSQVLNQIVHFNPIKTNNRDDILDVLAGAYKAMQDFGVALLRPFEALESNTQAETAETLSLGF